MKRLMLFFAVCFMCLFTGCSCVSIDDYNILNNEVVRLKEKLEQYEPEEEKIKATISGTFTATVRDIIPDYCLDDFTPQVAVLTLFQDGPFTFYLGESLAKQIEKGKTYVFEVEEKTVDVSKEEFDKGISFADEAVLLYNLKAKSIRAANEDEIGIECSNIYFETAQ